MTEQLYRVPTEDIITGDFENALTADIDCARPPDPRSTATRWYCGNSGCEVRDVRVASQYAGGLPAAKPPPMKCPRCGEAMRFESYLAEQLLMPVEK